jgi:hypothetical protein
MNTYKVLTANLGLTGNGKLVLLYLLSINKKEIEAQIKYIGEIICGFVGCHVHRQMTKIINELVEQGYILPLKDVYAKNKFKSKKWTLTAKALKLAKDDNTDSQGSKAKATSNKINIPTQVNDTQYKGVEVNANKKETAPQQAQLSLAELRRNYPIED